LKQLLLEGKLVWSEVTAEGAAMPEKPQRGPIAIMVSSDPAAVDAQQEKFLSQIQYRVFTEKDLEEAIHAQAQGPGYRVPRGPRKPLPISPEQQSLVDLLNTIGDLIGMPRLTAEDAKTMAEDMETYLDRLHQGPEADLEPVVTLRMTWHDGQTGELLFTMNDLECRQGATLNLEPMSGSWEHPRVQIEVVSINPTGSVEGPFRETPRARTSSGARGEVLPEIELVPVHLEESLLLGMDTRVVFVAERDRTTAQLYHQGTWYLALARCHPQDRYDLATGRKLAFARALRLSGMSVAERYDCWQLYFAEYPDDREPRRER
jgi:hypothetical protein